MKNKLGIYAGLIIVMSLLAWAGHASAQKTNTNNDQKVWEYKVGAATVSSLGGFGSVQDQLNQLGAEGWELVAVENVSTTAPASAVYYLKRLKAKEKE